MTNDPKLLISSMESIWSDIQTASRVLDVTVAMSQYQHKTGLESNPLLLEVADYAIRDTDLTRDDIIKVSSEDIDLSNFVGNLVRTIYEGTMRLIDKFGEWLHDQTSSQVVTQSKLAKLRELLKTMSVDPEPGLGLPLSHSAVRTLQIDYKVITNTKSLITELEEYCKFSKVMVEGYADGFLQLVSHLNDVLSKTLESNQVPNHIKNINSKVGDFFKVTDGILTHSDLEKNARSRMYLGNVNLYRYGVSPELLQRLKLEQPLTSELSKVTFKVVNDTKDDVYIEGKFTMPLFTRTECTTILDVAESTIKEIIDYNRGMERNIAVQLKNMKAGQDTLKDLDKNLDGKRIVVDGKSSVDDLGKLRELYRYQAPIWKWGTMPVAAVISNFNTIIDTYESLMKKSIKYVASEVKNAKS